MQKCPKMNKYIFILFAKKLFPDIVSYTTCLGSLDFREFKLSISPPLNSVIKQKYNQICSRAVIVIDAPQIFVFNHVSQL